MIKINKCVIMKGGKEIIVLYYASLLFAYFIKYSAKSFNKQKNYS